MIEHPSVVLNANNDQLAWGTLPGDFCRLSLRGPTKSTAALLAARIFRAPSSCFVLVVFFPLEYVSTGADITHIHTHSNIFGGEIVMIFLRTRSTEQTVASDCQIPESRLYAD